MAFRIELAQQTNLVSSGLNLLNIHCPKNPGHVNFKCLATPLNLPQQYRNQIIPVRSFCERVVKLEVEKMGRREVGTGFVTVHPNPRVNQYVIRTDSNLVRTQADVDNCDIYFDTVNAGPVLIRHGGTLIWSCPVTAVTFFTCDIPEGTTSTANILDRYPQLNITNKDGSQLVIRSHPDFKKDTFPPFLSPVDLNQHGMDMVIRFNNGSTSKLTSQFMTYRLTQGSELERHTIVKIHINDEVGNLSRVIPGDVWVLENRQVVRAHEPLLQDEIERSRLVLNGKIVGEGDRQYFHSMISDDYFRNGVGLDQTIVTQYFPNRVWFFDFKPCPEEDRVMSAFGPPQKERVGDDMLIISHAHGYSKTITVGKVIMIRGRRRMEYSCDTCPGSTGSPVFIFKNLACDVSASHHMGNSSNIGMTLSC